MRCAALRLLCAALCVRGEATTCAADGLRGALEQLLVERAPVSTVAVSDASNQSASASACRESASASASTYARGVRSSEAPGGRTVDAVIFSLCAALADPDETVRAAAFSVLVSSRFRLTLCSLFAARVSRCNLTRTLDFRLWSLMVIWS